MSVFDPIFDLLAWLLARFYDLVPSYGFAIIALTTLVLVVLSPLTYRSTKSMVQMRQVQPQVKRLQKKYKGDRETLNQEMMKLYQEHNVSPLSGCLPILIQSPVFIVMFRVIRGITRRASDIGFAVGGGAAREAEFDVNGNVEIFQGSVTNNFNPEYLDPESSMYQALVQDNEMLWLGLDLSRTPLEAIRSGLNQGVPYLLMVALVAFLGWFQQRQIQGRMTGEVSAQQQMIMRIIPWMLPIFAFTMPGGLVLYFIVSAMLRIIQQAYITKNVYQNEELNAPIDFGNEDDDEEEDDDDEPENPLAALFGGGGAGAKAKSSEPAASSRHGSRRPTSDAGRAQRSRPAKAPKSASSNGSKNSGSSKNGASANGSDAKGSKSAKNSKKRSASGDASSEKVTGWGRAKRSAPQSNETPAKPVSRRVTPKGDTSPKNRRGKK